MACLVGKADRSKRSRDPAIALSNAAGAGMVGRAMQGVAGNGIVDRP